MLRTLPAQSVQCCITSPPYYGLRDYQMDGQLGLEDTPSAYVARMVEGFREVRRVLADDGTLWLNLGDSYANDDKWGGSTGGKHVAALHGKTSLGRGRTTTGLAPKNLIGIPWRVAFALQDDGWVLRQDIIWHKPNPMPESVTDRCTKAHEYLFLFAKQTRYSYDHEAVREEAADIRGTVRFSNRRAIGGMGIIATGNEGKKSSSQDARKKHRNRRSVWTIATQPYAGAHFAVMPPALVAPCILAGCPEGGTVLDPFVGSGTVVAEAVRRNRHGIGIDLNPDYLTLARERIEQAVQPLWELL
jgi:DNA modification methylase